MPTNTTNMALPKPIDSDNAEAALASSIPTAFDKIDVHRHTGGADGLTAAGLAAGVATGAALGTDVVTLTGVQTLSNKILSAAVVLNGNPTTLNALGGGGGVLNFGDGAVNRDLVSVSQTQTLTNKSFGTNSDTDVKATFVMGDNWTLLQHLSGATIRLAFRPAVANRYFQIENTDGTSALAVKASSGVAGSQVVIGTPASDPGAGALGNSSIIFWLDEVGNNVKIRVRYSDGTAKLGIITLA